jgi:hypothetical protein
VLISLECRKRLYVLLKRATADPVFPTYSGLRLTTRNAYRDIKTICAAGGVTGPHIHPHAFRHCFAVTYIPRGGDIYRLSRLLGHASMTTTQRLSAINGSGCDPRRAPAVHATESPAAVAALDGSAGLGRGDQLGVGRSTESITSTSTGPFDAIRRSPS